MFYLSTIPLDMREEGLRSWRSAAKFVTSDELRMLAGVTKALLGKQEPITKPLCRCMTTFAEK